MAILLQSLFTSGAGAGWTLTDSEGKTSTVSGRLLFDGGKASPAWDDPRVRSTASFARSTVGAFSVLLRMTNNSDLGPRVSLSPSSSDSAASGSSVITYDYPDHLASWTANRLRGRAIDYLYVIVPRPGGGYWRFISGGEFGDFPTATLVGMTDTETNTPLYAHVSNNNSVFYADNATVLDTGSLPAALTSRFGPALAADDFASGSNLTGRSTPYGGKAWSVVSGSPTISAGNLNLPSGGVFQFDAGAAPRVVEGYLTRSDAGSRPMLYFRGNNTDAGSWRVKAEVDRVSLHNASGLVDQTGAITFTQGVSYHVRVLDYLDYIEVFVNGTRYINVTSSTGNTNTRCGVGCENGTGLCAELSVWPATVALNSDFGPHTAVPAGQGSALVTSTFTGTNGTPLTTHDSAWTVHTGTVELNSNRALIPAGGYVVAATRSTGSASTDHEARADIILPSTTPAYPIDWFPCVYARYTDINNLLMARFLYQDTSNEVELWQIVANTGTLIGYTNLGVSALAPSSTHNLRLAVAGAEAAAYLDGMLVVQATTSLLTGSRAGFGRREDNPANLSGTPAFDNFELRAAQAIGNPVISSLAAGSVTSTTATLSCTTDVNCTVYFEYGPTIAYGLTTSTTSAGTSHSRPITGLTPTTTYHFRAVATSA